MASFPSVQNHLKAFGIGILLAVVGIGAYVQWGSTTSTDLPTVTVYKSPTCSCCSNWIAHLEDNGFPVEAKDRANVAPVKRQLGVPEDLAACHTAVVEDYVVEGHVPAEQVKRLLRESPDLRGIAVAGMPAGSPGMEQGDYVEPYDVVAFTASGETTVVAQYGQEGGDQ